MFYACVAINQSLLLSLVAYTHRCPNYDEVARSNICHYCLAAESENSRHWSCGPWHAMMLVQINVNWAGGLLWIQLYCCLLTAHCVPLKLFLFIATLYICRHIKVKTQCVLIHFLALPSNSINFCCLLGYKMGRKCSSGCAYAKLKGIILSISQFCINFCEKICRFLIWKK